MTLSLTTIFAGLDVLFLAVFLVVNVVYLLMDLFAVTFMLRRDISHPAESPLAEPPNQPGITVVVPAYNEEEIVRDTVWSLLKLNYDAYEILVVDDGSTDGTLGLLRDTFGLEPVPDVYREQLRTEPVHQIYRSDEFENLRVISKDNGKRHDALNAGINAARYPLVCTIDADSLLEHESLRRVAEMFVRYPEMLAVGGSVRVMDVCTVEQGEIQRVKVPRNPWLLLQTVEYIRSFLFGRVGWNHVNGLMIISGAFGVFRKQALLDVGGFRDTFANDMEIVVRLHREYSRRDEPYKIWSIPEPVCWTEVPDNLPDFYRQRVVWQKGIMESLTWNRDLCFRGGGAGWLGFPYTAFMEGISVPLEILGYLYMIGGYAAGIVAAPVLMLFLWVAIGLGTVHSVVCLVMEETYFRQFPGRRHILPLFLTAVVENFGYRQFNTVCRLVGLWQWLRERRSAPELPLRTRPEAPPAGREDEAPEPVPAGTSPSAAD